MGQCVNANEIIDTLWDTKLKGLNMTELIVSYSNNLGEIWRNMAEKTNSLAIKGKNGQKSDFVLKSVAIRCFRLPVKDPNLNCFQSISEKLKVESWSYTSAQNRNN